MENGDIANKKNLYDDTSLKEHGEMYDYSFIDGPEPKSYESVSLASGKSRVKRKSKTPTKRSLTSMVDSAKKNLNKKGGIVSNVKKKQQAEKKKIAEQVRAINSRPGIKIPPAPKAPKKSGLSTGAKIGIGIGVAVLLGAIGFVVYKVVKKK